MEIKLDSWQEEILDYDGHILLCTGRRVGKTYIMAVKAVEEMMKRPGIRIVVVSLTEDQAKLIIAFAQNYARQKYKKFIGRGKDKPTQSSLVLNKGKMLARPVGNTGDAVRGFEGNILIIDEASRFPEVAFTAATPVLLTTGGKIWICSTPFGRRGYFYKSWLNKEGRFKVWHKSSVEVIEERPISGSWTEQLKIAAKQFLEEERQDKSVLEFGQEYEGKFIDDLRQLFSDELIAKCMNTKRPGIIDRHATHYLGVDIGRLGDDPSTFEIMKRQEDRLVHVENELTRKTILTKTADKVFDMNTQYDFGQIFVDDEGIGIGVFDMLISDERTRRKTKGLKNSKKVLDYKDDKKTRMLKVDLYMNLLRLMEQGRIDLLDDENVRLSLKSVQYEDTTDKKGKPFMHIFGNDTHITEGIIRAAWGIKDKINKLWIDYF